MATKNFLQIVQQAQAELGLPVASAVCTNLADITVSQFYYLSLRDADELYNMASGVQGWPQLRKEYVFNLVGVSNVTATFTSGSNVVTGVSPTTGIVDGMVITAQSLFGGENVTVLSGGGTSTLTISQNAVESQTETTVSFGQQAYDYPSDLAYFITQTQWDRNFRWQLLGPLSPQEWQVIKSGISPVGPRIRFRLMDGQIYFDPVSGNNDQIVFEYYSNGWCTSASGTPQNKWLADTDLPVLNPELHILGLKWRFLRSKGLDYTEEKNTWERTLFREMSRAGLSRSLPINAQSGNLRLLSMQNLPDTGFGS